MMDSSNVQKWAELGTLVRKHELHDFKFIIPTGVGPSIPIKSHQAFLKARLPGVCGADAFVLPSWVQPKAFRLFSEVCK